MATSGKPYTWDTHDEIGPQPPCAGADLDNETGLMPYSQPSQREDKPDNEH